MGGFYERLVGLVKRSLRKSVGRNLLSDTQPETLLKEIETVVNSRPLVYIGDGIDSSITLTPGHFLTLNPKAGVPELEFEQADPDFDYFYWRVRVFCGQIDTNLEKRSKVLKRVLEIMAGDYLLNLSEQTENTLKTGRIVSHNTLQIGDIVLVKHDLPSGCWRMGKVVELAISADSNVRSVKVKLHTGRIIGRPRKLLFPVEVSAGGNERNEMNEILLQQIQNMTGAPYAKHQNEQKRK